MRSLWVVCALALSCSPAADSPVDDAGLQQQGIAPPVVLNPDAPVEYPPDLYSQGIEGTVVLLLYVDERGQVVPESTRVAEGSGHPRLDSAALNGVARMQFAPAVRDSVRIATAFLQPVHFRQPERAAAGDTR